MAVTMSGATVDQSTRKGLLNQNLTQSTLGSAEELNSSLKMDNSGSWLPSFHLEASGNKVAGITANFLSDFTSSVDGYASDVRKSIDKLSSVQEDYMNNAFKGSEVGKAITKFIESVKQVANNYLNTLQEAENQIAKSVQAAYQQQDTDVSSDLNRDSSTLVDAGPKVQ